MTLNPEWRRRVENWRNALPRLFYSELGEVELSCFVTDGSMLPEVAKKEVLRQFRPKPLARKAELPRFAFALLAERIVFGMGLEILRRRHVSEERMAVGMVQGDGESAAKCEGKAGCAEVRARRHGIGHLGGRRCTGRS